MWVRYIVTVAYSLMPTFKGILKITIFVPRSVMSLNGLSFVSARSTPQCCVSDLVSDLVVRGISRIDTVWEKWITRTRKIKCIEKQEWQFIVIVIIIRNFFIIILLHYEVPCDYTGPLRDQGRQRSRIRRNKTGLF